MAVTTHQTIAEMEAALGANLKALRLDLNIDQQTVAGRAGISISALKNLENGRGSTVRTLVATLRALGRAEWLATVAPIASIDPLTHTAAVTPRQRAAPAKSRE